MIKQQEGTTWEDAGKSADKIVKLIGNTTAGIIQEAGKTGKSAGKAVTDTTVDIINETGRRVKAVVNAGLGKSSENPDV